MKRIITASLLCLAAARFHFNPLEDIALSGLEKVEEKFFEQPKDHFNALSNGKWMQRYWINDEYFDGTGPLFLNVQGEWTASPSCATGGLAVELAKEYGALVVCLEHRFYGKSQVHEDYEIAHMAELSSHQAVADIASFLAWLYEQHEGITKTISFGCSYAGYLSAMARNVLPHLIHGAIASSAPMMSQPDGHESFNTYVAEALADPKIGGSPECLNAVRESFVALDRAMRGNKQERDAMFEKLHSCEASEEPRDIMWFATNAATFLQLGVQYNNRPGREDPAADVKRICGLMLSKESHVDSLAALIDDSINRPDGPLPSIARWMPLTCTEDNTKCCVNNDWSDYIEKVAGNTVMDTTNPNDSRAWFYQCCTQYGYCSWGSCKNADTCPFSPLMNIEDEWLLCKDAFGPEVSPPNNVPRVKWQDDYLGGYNTAPGRVLFVNGDRDPWASISSIPEHNLNPSNPTIMIEGGSHCVDYGPSHENDTPSIKKARENIRNTINQWMGQPKYGFPGPTTEEVEKSKTLMVVGFTVLGTALFATIIALFITRKRYLAAVGGGSGGDNYAAVPDFA